METELVPAPETGTPLFCMNAIVSVPPSIDFKKLNEELGAIGAEEAVEVDIATYIEAGQEVGV
jgi:glycine cleavage system regulatory protein